MNVHIKVTVLVSENDSVLLIKEWGKSKSGYYWNTVKGSYENEVGETILECAEREAEEEANIKAKVSGLISCYLFSKKDEFNIQYNFLGKPLRGNTISVPPKKEQKLRSEDIQEVRWFSREELLKMSPSDFLSNRAYLIIESWLKNEVYPVDVFRQLSKWD